MELLNNILSNLITDLIVFGGGVLLTVLFKKTHLFTYLNKCIKKVQLVAINATTPLKKIPDVKNFIYRVGYI